MPPSRRASRVPPELDRIALKALAPELKNRYARCEELRSDLAAFLAQNHPGTDTARVARFLGELYAEDMAAEQARARRADREGARVVLQQAPAGATARDDHVDHDAAAGAVGAAPPPRRPSAPASRRDGVAVRRRYRQRSTPVTPPGRHDWRERGERGTVVSGPVRHDHARDKKLTVRGGAGRDAADRLAAVGRSFHRRAGDGRRRPLLRPQAVRRGRHGARLRGRAHRHRQARRAEDPAPRLQPDARSGRAPAARGARRRRRSRIPTSST